MVWFGHSELGKKSKDHLILPLNVVVPNSRTPHIYQFCLANQGVFLRGLFPQDLGKLPAELSCCVEDLPSAAPRDRMLSVTGLEAQCTECRFEPIF